MRFGESTMRFGESKIRTLKFMQRGWNNNRAALEYSLIYDEAYPLFSNPNNIASDIMGWD